MNRFILWFSLFRERRFLVVSELRVLQLGEEIGLAGAIVLPRLAPVIRSLGKLTKPPAHGIFVA